MSILFDASCGMGELASSYPLPLTISTTASSNAAGSGSGSGEDAVGSSGVIHVPCGYAGGMGPDSIHTVLHTLSGTTNGSRIWVDMESRLRTLTVVKGQSQPVDIFDINKCF